jgi:hypothetical protein
MCFYLLGINEIQLEKERFRVARRSCSQRTLCSGEGRLIYHRSHIKVSTFIGHETFDSGIQGCVVCASTDETAEFHTSFTGCEPDKVSVFRPVKRRN